MILVVCVSYNGSKDLDAYLESLQFNSFTDWRLVVVNNSLSALEADKIDDIVAHDSRAIHIRAPKNLGYFGGARYALRSLDKSVPEWILVTNTDLVFDRHFLLSISEKDPNSVGLLAPSLIEEATGFDQNPYMLLPPSRADLLRRHILASSPFTAQACFLLSTLKRRLLATIPHRRRGPSQELEIYAPHGGLVVLSRRFFEVGGTLNHPMFLFGEENHLARECERLGLQILYSPSARAVHRFHAQTGGWLRSPAVLRAMVEAARYEYSLRSRLPESRSWRNG